MKNLLHLFSEGFEPTNMAGFGLAIITLSLSLHATLLLIFLNTAESQSIIKTLPGFDGDIPFKLETGSALRSLSFQKFKKLEGSSLNLIRIFFFLGLELENAYSGILVWEQIKKSRCFITSLSRREIPRRTHFCYPWPVALAALLSPLLFLNLVWFPWFK